MNSRGQAALEYLMTYGWALVIIVVVAGILFFLMSSPSSGVTCNSSDPTKIVLTTDQTKGGTADAFRADLVVQLQNGTGGNISTIAIADADKTGDFKTGAGTAKICTASGATCTAATTATGAATMYLYPQLATAKITGNPMQASSVKVTYNDQFNYSKSVTITCQGSYE